MSNASQSSLNDIAIPLWDVLPCNAYLVSLLPIEEACRYLPGIASFRNEVYDILRFLAAAWLLSSQQITTKEWNVKNVFQNRSQIALFSLFAMDWAPTLCRMVMARPMARYSRIPSQPSIEASAIAPPNRISQLAAQRHEHLVKIFQSIWPLIRLGLWLQLTQSHNDDTKKTPLYALYAHRRWLHEQGMELWPAIVGPLLQSSRETRRWLHQLWRQLCNR